MLFNKYPYTDMHELNLDWILAKMKELDQEVDDFTVFNTITWAGVWDATKSYVKWSIVQDTNGNGYLSLQPVPPNVPLTNTAYWTRVANYDALYSAFNYRITYLEGCSVNAKLIRDNPTLNASDIPFTPPADLSSVRVQSAIEEAVGTHGNGYFTLPSGILICYGTVSQAGISPNQDVVIVVDLPFRFIDNTYSVEVTPANNGVHFSVGVCDANGSDVKTTGQFALRIKNRFTAALSGSFQYVAIGRYK